MNFQTTFLKLVPEAVPQDQQPNSKPPVETVNSAGGLLKKCFKCGKEKPRENFYGHSRMADGLLGKCKDCTKKDFAENEAKCKTNPDWVSKERARNRERMARLRSLGICRTTSKKARKTWVSKNPHKRYAQNVADRAYKNGEIKKPDKCEACGTVGYVEKHHPDYSKPLFIQWLCTKCHGLTRRK